MISDFIIQNLPYDKPFLFVDQIIDVNEDYIKGTYTFNKDEFFYKGHFKDNPVTPGVILTECMAQIGLAGMGIYMYKDKLEELSGVAMTSNTIDYYKPVFPGEKVTVIADKEYFRFQKLKCNIAMYNEKDVLVAKGSISGMIAKFHAL
ncbi:FabA/FabZ family ACP-dehydratase [Aquimarina sp. MMG016]|uniref:3-hydroxyacyl-ACP dehydratase FabZ family protein n=1 Tax=Aquimarina sp. MMG016 TaxID=2822690 RepID=UPI001B3A5004|nr:hydroxymyristoyl-ACP dehydratase [Aquimarina sp. MMG016]